jgi:UDP-N-acetylglucosamine transferase subunit ALG13
VDEWAQANGRTDVVAQIGDSRYRPRTIEAHRFLPPQEFMRLQNQAELLVAHCGTGSMLSALEIGQPVLMMPRRHSLDEHRNDHQWATAQHVRNINGVHVALDEEELHLQLTQLANSGRGTPISAKAPREFTDRLELILRELI